MKNNTALINLLFPTQGTSTYITNILLILFGTILLAISSKIQVPFWPVPMTMQTFIVFLIGMTYGWRLSFFTLLAYLVEGALGLPVFAKGGGLMYLTGPTAGYLYGMLGAAFASFVGLYLYSFSLQFFTFKFLSKKYKILTISGYIGIFIFVLAVFSLGDS